MYNCVVKSNSFYSIIQKIWNLSNGILVFSEMFLIILFLTSRGKYFRNAYQNFEYTEFVIIQNFNGIKLFWQKYDMVVGTGSRAMIGALRFSSHLTKPNISAAAGIVPQFNKKPTKFLLKWIQTVFHYLKNNNWSRYQI